jgi:hypothetical protein
MIGYGRNNQLFLENDKCGQYLATRHADVLKLLNIIHFDPENCGINR